MVSSDHVLRKILVIDIVYKLWQLSELILIFFWIQKIHGIKRKSVGKLFDKAQEYVHAQRKESKVFFYKLPKYATKLPKLRRLFLYWRKIQIIVFKLNARIILLVYDKKLENEASQLQKAMISYKVHPDVITSSHYFRESYL